MARCAAGGRGVTTVPDPDQGPNLYCSAVGGIRLIEVGVFNTTTSAVCVGLVLATTAGTKAGSITPVCEDDPSYAVKGTVNTSQSAGATVGAAVRQASLGAAIGSGVIWTFGPHGVWRDQGTGNGFVINCPTGTGQFLDFYWCWEE